MLSVQFDDVVFLASIFPQLLLRRIADNERCRLTGLYGHFVDARIRNRNGIENIGVVFFGSSAVIGATHAVLMTNRISVVVLVVARRSLIDLFGVGNKILKASRAAALLALRFEFPFPTPTATHSSTTVSKASGPFEDSG
uniref:Uncharacterized protein n=1 Tax=Romanomermis culicivorax TaxID=13658 RepID=A0A915JGW9_ROMCU